MNLTINMKNSNLLIAFFGLFCVVGVSSFKYMGVSQSGAEWGSNIPGTYYVDYVFPKTSSIDYFVSNGMNTIRIPFLWERIQPTLGGSFDSNYLALLDATVQYCTVTKGVYALIDVHNYGRYNNVILGMGVDYSQFQALWVKLANLYKNNPKVIFGLMNEPNEMPYNNVYQLMQAGINGIRSTGATNLITVLGNDWTGVHSWMDGNAAAMAPITDPLNNFMFEMHQYFDNNYSGNGACVASFDPAAIFGPATAWLRSQGRTGFLGEFGIEKSSQCLTVLASTMAYLEANSDVWVGWAWWAAGPWWGSYKFSLEQGAGDAQMAVLKNYMKVTSTPTPAPTPVPTPTPAPTPVPTPTVSLTTGRVVATPAPTPVVSTPVPSTPSTPVATPSSPSAGSCVSGMMRCLSANTYSTCNWGAWAGAQSCGSGTVCSPSGDVIYCVASTTPIATPPVVSTPTPAPTPVPTPAPTPVPTPAPVQVPTPAPTPVVVTPLTTGQKSVATPSTPSSTPSSSNSCSFGQLRCVGASSYQSCGNGANGPTWAAPQQCQAGLSCHAAGNQIYCY